MSAQDAPELGTEGRFWEEFKRIVQDLTTLEINTIIKDNMTARPMPDVPNALVDIAASYLAKLEDLRLDISAAAQVAADAQEATWSALPVHHGVGAFYRVPAEFTFKLLFEQIRWGARRGRELHGNRFDASETILLRRIEDNSDRVRAILQAVESGAGEAGDGPRDLARKRVSLASIRANLDVFVPPPDLSLQQRLAIKKIWEIGTEQVIVQTVIPIDGDVITRLSNSDLIERYDRDEVDQLLSIHQQGVASAISHWRALLESARLVAAGLANFALGR